MGYRKKPRRRTAIEDASNFSPSIEMLISDLYVSIGGSTCLGLVHRSLPFGPRGRPGLARGVTNSALRRFRPLPLHLPALVPGLGVLCSELASD